MTGSWCYLFLQVLRRKKAGVAQNQEEYQKHYSELVERYDKAKEKHDELSYKIEQKKAHSEKMKLFIKALKEQDSIMTEFNDALWGSLVDFITIGKKERTVTFEDGTVIDVWMILDRIALRTSVLGVFLYKFI